MNVHECDVPTRTNAPTGILFISHAVNRLLDADGIHGIDR